MAQIPDTGGIVLCGGKSTRMGRPKAWLPFGDEPMLPHVVRILSEVVSPIVVVAAKEQELPLLPADVLVVRDEYDALGPLAGLAAGLAVLRGKAAAAYASSCDVPLLKPEFVRYITELLGEYDMVIPRDGKFHHPLAAVYRTKIEADMRALIDENRLRPFFLLERVCAREVDVAELRHVDPELQSLLNVNTPEEYSAALNMVGLSSAS